MFLPSKPTPVSSSTTSGDGSATVITPLNVMSFVILKLLPVIVAPVIFPPLIVPADAPEPYACIVFEEILHPLITSPFASTVPNPPLVAVTFPLIVALFAFNVPACVTLNGAAAICASVLDPDVAIAPDQIPYTPLPDIPLVEVAAAGEVTILALVDEDSRVTLPEPATLDIVFAPTSQ